MGSEVGASTGARLVPADFDLSLLPAESERRTVGYFLSGLDESWFVIPKVPVVVDSNDREIDIVLVSFDHGAFLVEVKGGIITVQEGAWRQNGRAMDDPVEQVVAAKHHLIRRLRRNKVDLNGIFLQHIVAFPDIVDFPSAGAGPHCPREIVLTRAEMEHPLLALQHIARSNVAPGATQLEAFIRALRPDVTEMEVDGSHVHGATNNLHRNSVERLGPVIGLDENRRVYLRGSAGTGKTYVGTRWARRAMVRGESVLYVCYNNLLGAEMISRLNEMSAEIGDCPRVDAGSFHAVLRRLMGADAPPIPPASSTQSDFQRYWDHELPAAFENHAIGEDSRFDVIIVDEAQDFHPHWLEMLERLLVDRALSRFYLLADSKQAIYSSNWVPPSGITTLELTQNVRNTNRIGTVVRSLGGAELPRAVIPGPAVQFHAAAGMKEAVKHVRRSLECAMNDLGIPASQLMVLARHRELRDRLCDAFTDDIVLDRWERRSEEIIACETIHRTKGLERIGVVLVDLDDEPDTVLTYVGASRASAFLSIIGSRPLIDRLTATPG